MLVVALWKIGSSAEALPEADRRDVCCGVISHKFFDSGRSFSGARVVLFR